ncbi:MAG: TRM11 family SAM-dependent methyltransferase [Thermoplasmata archaeon]
MMRAYVELSGESRELAAAESAAASEALGGRAVPDPRFDRSGLVAVEMPDEPSVRALAARIALARRCLLSRGTDVADALVGAASSGGSAAVRRLGRPTSGGDDPALLSAGRAYKAGGGTIDLEEPSRRFWLVRETGGNDCLFEEVARVDRPSASARRMPALPFRRPVSLPPRLARAAANLARVRPGDRVVDPFLGTGALLAEAGLLGARLFGIDRDADMVRGALRNLAHLDVVADELVVGDAGEAEFVDPTAPFDAVLTDPPYGRASSTGGEGAAAVVDRVLPRWAARVRPGGRLVVVVSAPVRSPGPEWRSVVAVPVRVHRSLTREFRVYERASGQGQ